MQVNDYVDIKNKLGEVDPTDPNCEGRITDIDPSGEYVYISNTNMPFMGTYSGKLFHVSSIVERECEFTVEMED